MDINAFSKTNEWNVLAGVPTFSEFTDDLFDFDYNGGNMISYRISLITEEFKELMDGLGKNNIMEVFDALCDLRFVIQGMASSLGIPFQEEMIKRTSTSDSWVLDKFLGKSDVEQLSQHLTDYSSVINVKVELMKRQIDKLKEYVNKRSKEGVVDMLCSLEILVYELGIFIGFDMNTGMEMVTYSNMTKFCTTEEDAIRSVNNYKENDDRYDSPAYRKEGNYYIIFNDSSEKYAGKILKFVDYKDFVELFE